MPRPPWPLLMSGEKKEEGNIPRMKGQEQETPTLPSSLGQEGRPQGKGAGGQRPFF